VKKNVPYYIEPPSALQKIENLSNTNAITYQHLPGSKGKPLPFPLPYIVGDCILPLPNRFRGKYTVLEKDFGLEMGEYVTFTFRGTPYVQYFTKKGSCLPAVAFVASMLLKDEGVAIHSLAEIAKLTTEQEFGDHAVVIKHTSPTKIAKYFIKHVHLNVYLQKVFLDSRIQTPGDYQSDTDKYRVLLRAYLSSGMPVILPVDYFRLHGKTRQGAAEMTTEGIYPKNLGNPDVLVLQDEPSDNGDPHAIIAVGYGKNPDNKDCFLVHDPVYLPFLEASAEQLLDARCYSGGNVRNLENVYALPVAPQKVKMPLFDTRPVFPETLPQLGVHTIFLNWYLLAPKLNIPLPIVRPEEGEWALVQVKAGQIKAKLIQIIGEGVFAGSTLEKLEIELRLRAEEGHWVWVQWFAQPSPAGAKSVWVWDAEQEPPRDIGFDGNYQEGLTRYFMMAVEETTQTNRLYLSLNYEGVHTLFLNWCLLASKLNIPLPTVTPEEGEWALVQVNAGAGQIKAKLIQIIGDGVFDDSILENLEVELCKRVQEGHWIWVQWFAQPSPAGSKSIWVWDAEQEPPRNIGFEGNYKGYFIRYFIMAVEEAAQTNRLYLSPDYENEIQVEDENQEPVNGNDGIADENPPRIEDIAIISSFTTEGYQKCHEILNGLGELGMGLELYVFIQSDVNRLADFLGSKGHTVNRNSAVDFLASLALLPVECIGEVAEKVRDGIGQRLVRSLATFCPEIMSANEEKRKIGKRALYAACHLLAYLQPDETQPRYLEMVGGGNCLGVGLWNEEGGQQVLASPLLTDEKRKEYMKDCLTSIAAIVCEKNIHVVIEIEPGKMFAFNDRKSIIKLIDIFDEVEQEYGLPKGCFGLNLDVAHWVLVSPPDGLPPSWLTNPAGRIYERVSHAHVTDGFCHLSDIPFGAKMSPAQVKSWVHFLRTRYADQTPGLPKCSGFISVEIECSCDDPYTGKAIANARRIF